eukprot:m.12480 g.12480  ORF g.12480 m.12480 type:complete len:708 (+) comp4659_c0_seq1:137-2260(+)
MNEQPNAQDDIRRGSWWDMFLGTTDKEAAELARRKSSLFQPKTKISKQNIKKFEKAVHQIAQQAAYCHNEDDTSKKNKKSKKDCCPLPNIILGEDIKRHEIVGKGHFGIIVRAAMRAVPPNKKEKEAKTPPLIRRKGIESPGVTRKQQADDIPVAVKELMVKQEMTVDDIKVFFQEGIITAQFQHENVIRCYGLTPFPLGIVLEYCPLGDLKTNLRKLKLLKSYFLPAQDCIEICFQVCQGMSHIASKNFIHGDLAARNILIAEDYTCKVGDLGMAKKCGAESHFVGEKVPLPTKWCSPELLMENNFSEKSDVWAWAILNLEVLNGGSPPYADKNKTEVMMHIGTGNGPDKSDTCPSEYWDKVLAPCFATDPNKRPTFSLLLDLLAEFNEKNVERKSSGSIGAAKLFLEDTVEQDDHATSHDDASEGDYDDDAAQQAQAIVFDCKCVQGGNGLCSGDCGHLTSPSKSEKGADSPRRPGTPTGEDARPQFFPKQSLYRTKGRTMDRRQRSALSDHSGVPSSLPGDMQQSVTEDAPSVANTESTSAGRIMITAEQVGSIEFIWLMALAPARSGTSGMDTVGLNFFKEMFRISPQVQESFGERAKDEEFLKFHARKFLKATSHSISLLSKPNEFRDYVLNLGGRHVDRIRGADYFLAAGQAMTEAIYSELNTKFTEEAQEAFNMFLQVFVNLMHQGWKRALAKKQEEEAQ